MFVAAKIVVVAYPLNIVVRDAEAVCLFSACLFPFISDHPARDTGTTT